MEPAAVFLVGTQRRHSLNHRILRKLKILIINYKLLNLMVHMALDAQINRLP